MAIGITLDDVNKFNTTQDSIAAVESPPGSGAFGSAVDSFDQTAESFAEDFPLATAFGGGLANSLSLGVSGKLAKHDLISAEGVAQLAGQFVGEIPYWFVGG